MAAAEAPAADPEPCFKYQRLGGSVSKILANDPASCLAAHTKFLALGTEGGAVHVLDLSGHEIRRFSPHSAAVADICVDATGEFVGSCSMDGTVVVSSLFGGEASTHWYHRPVRAIALDSEYAARRVFATGGLACQLVINSRGWFGSKDNVVHSGEGPIQAIAMAGPMLAWANDHGVKVYDAQHAKRVSYIERTPGSPPPHLFRCHLRWESRQELIIGWADTIKIGRVKERDAGPGAAAAPGVGQMGAVPISVGTGGIGGVYMEIVTLIQTDFYICGLAGVSLRSERGQYQPDLLVLAYVCESSDEDRYGAGGAAPGGAQRPELRLLSRHNEEFFTDALSLEGFGDLRCGSYSLTLAPPAAAGQVAPGGNSNGGGGGSAGPRPRSATGDGAGAMAAMRGEDQGQAGAGSSSASASALFADDMDDVLLPATSAYILSPKDIILATTRDWDDRVSWLLSHGRVEDALHMAMRHEAELLAHKVIDIAEARIGQLLESGEHAAAAALCAEHLGRASTLWARWLHAFASAGALSFITPHVPVSDPMLPQQAYEHALSCAIGPSSPASEETPGTQLLALLKQWPASAYRPAVVQRALLEAARKLPGGLLAQPRLMEAMALLHCQAKQHEAALRLLLQLSPTQVDVFGFIELHSVHAYCRDKVAALAAHSWDKTLAMLLRYTEAIPPQAVVSQLHTPTGVEGALGDVGNEKRLLEYLHALFLHDVHMGAPFHGRQLALYARHSPDLLLPFLKGSPHYPLDIALDVCKSHGIVQGQVFVLGRMGAHSEALALMLDSLQDIKGAIEFVRQRPHEVELWRTLLTHAMKHEPLREALLDHVSAEPLGIGLDMQMLVRALPDGVKVQSLPQRLHSLLMQAVSQEELLMTAVKAAQADSLSLMKERHALRMKAVPLADARPLEGQMDEGSLAGVPQ